MRTRPIRTINLPLPKRAVLDLLGERKVLNEAEIEGSHLLQESKILDASGKLLSYRQFVDAEKCLV